MRGPASALASCSTEGGGRESALTHCCYPPPRRHHRHRYHQLVSTLSFNQPHLLQRDGDLTDVSDTLKVRTQAETNAHKGRSCHWAAPASLLRAPADTRVPAVSNVPGGILSSCYHKHILAVIISKPVSSFFCQLCCSSYQPPHSVQPPRPPSFFLSCTRLGCGCLISTPSALHGPYSQGAPPQTHTYTHRQQHSLEFSWQGLPCCNLLIGVCCCLCMRACLILWMLRSPMSEPLSPLNK